MAELTQEQKDSIIENHPLYSVYRAAIEQAAFGKGERHGGCETPFLDQRWKRIADGLCGPRGLAFQAIKKLEEALDKPDKESFERELLGAMVYMGMIHITEMGVKGDNTV